MQGVLKSRAVLSLKGEDSRPFLQGIVTQDVAGGVLFTALLTPQGKILFDFFLVPQVDGFFIDCDAGAADALLKRLTLYKLRAKIALAAEPGLAVAIGDAPSSFADPRLADLPRRAVVKHGDDAAAVDDAYDAARIALGVAEFGRDFSSDEVFLLEVNYDRLNAVSYKKGCFVGQEVTSRMKRKGDVRKRTLIARFDGPPPAKGTAILADATAVGEILSGRDGAALALVRIDRLKAAQDAGKRLTADGRDVTIAVPRYLEPV